MKKIFAIHGAYSTPTIFNYVQHMTKSWTWQMFDYSGEINNFEQLCKIAASEITSPCHVIGHSMGGMIALSLANHEHVKSITTIASPLNGLDVNLIQTYMSRSSFIRELQKGSSFVRKLQKQEYHIPVQHIITTQGFNPYMAEENDGVVGLKTQREWSIGETHEIKANHAEVMQHDGCVALIKSFIS